MTKTYISVAEAKKRLSELLSRVAGKRDEFVIRRHGKPIARLMPIEEDGPLIIDPAGGLTEAEHAELMAEIRRGRQQLRPCRLFEAARSRSSRGPSKRRAAKKK